MAPPHIGAAEGTPQGVTHSFSGWQAPFLAVALLAEPGRGQEVKLGSLTQPGGGLRVVVDEFN